MSKSDHFNASSPSAAFLRAAAVTGGGLVLAGLVAARARVSRGIKTMQYARMMSVLSGFSDAHLAVHGITRDEIHERAAELVGYEQK